MKNLGTIRVEVNGLEDLKELISRQREMLTDLENNIEKIGRATMEINAELSINKAT